MCKTKNCNFYFLLLATTWFFLCFFIAPQFSVWFSEYWLKLLCADAGHVKLRCCTLYSVYAISENYNAVCLFHAVISGSDNDRAWKIVLSFLSQHFSSLNESDVSSMRDKDKGLKGALVSSNLHIQPFQYTFHQPENVEKARL